MVVFKTEKEKAEAEMLRQKAIVDKFTAEENRIAREVQAKKNKKEKELRQYKEDNFNYAIGQPLSYRLAKFYLVLARDTVLGLSQIEDLKKKMNLVSYFKKLDEENKDSIVQCPVYDLEYTKVN